MSQEREVWLKEKQNFEEKMKGVGSGRFSHEDLSDMLTKIMDTKLQEYSKITTKKVTSILRRSQV